MFELPEDPPDLCKPQSESAELVEAGDGFDALLNEGDVRRVAEGLKCDPPLAAALKLGDGRDMESKPPSSRKKLTSL